MSFISAVGEAVRMLRNGSGRYQSVRCWDDSSRHLAFFQGTRYDQRTHDDEKLKQIIAVDQRSNGDNRTLNTNCHASNTSWETWADKHGSWESSGVGWGIHV